MLDTGLLRREKLFSRVFCLVVGLDLLVGLLVRLLESFEEGFESAVYDDRGSVGMSDRLDITRNHSYA